MIAGNFLAVNKEHFGTGLDSCELLILAQVEEFQRNQCQCFVTNEQFAEMFGESLSKIKRRLDSLEEKGIIYRTDSFVPETKKKRRVIYLTEKRETLKNGVCQVQITDGGGSNLDKDRFRNHGSEVHGEPIKDNLKNNLKENIIKDNIIYNGKTNTPIIDQEEKKKRKIRTIHELEIEEGDDIADSVKYGLDTYVNLQRKYNLEFGSITKEFGKQWREEKCRRNGLSYSDDGNVNELRISQRVRKENKAFVDDILASMCSTDDQIMHEQREYECYEDEGDWDEDL